MFKELLKWFTKPIEIPKFECENCELNHKDTPFSLSDLVSIDNRKCPNCKKSIKYKWPKRDKFTANSKQVKGNE